MNQVAQPGHKETYRELLLPEKVDQFITCLPPEHCDCGGAIQLNNSNFQKHQVWGKNICIVNTFNQ